MFMQHTANGNEYVHGRCDVTCYQTDYLTTYKKALQVQKPCIKSVMTA